MPDDAMPAIDIAENTANSEFGAGETVAEEIDPREPNPEFDLAAHLVEAERLERNLANINRTATRRSSVPARKSRVGLPTGLAAFAATFALIAGAAYEYRQALVRAVPQTAVFYELVGLEVNIRGMEFANVVVEREFENGLPVLAVSGEIVNIAERSLNVPRLRFGLRDHSKQEIYHWTMAVATGQLAPEGRARFLTKLAAPPAAAHDVEVRFHNVGSRRAGN
ncbi:MAG: DUF3426 domain-containing protein [Rhizobiales bacterium]|nr:DUF3426 domain-containing protein [Hyphomicrobiales bacterium]